MLSLYSSLLMLFFCWIDRLINYSTNLITLTTEALNQLKLQEE